MTLPSAIVGEHAGVHSWPGERPRKWCDAAVLEHRARICCFWGSPHSKSLFWLRMSPGGVASLSWPLPRSPGLDSPTWVHSESKSPINHPSVACCLTFSEKTNVALPLSRAQIFRDRCLGRMYYLSQWTQSCLLWDTSEDKKLYFTVAVLNLVWMNWRPKQELGGVEKETISHSSTNTGRSMFSPPFVFVIQFQ